MDVLNALVAKNPCQKARTLACTEMAMKLMAVCSPSLRIVLPVIANGF